MVTPPPPAQQAKPLGVDDDMSVSGIAALRTGGRSGLSIGGRSQNTTSRLGTGGSAGGASGSAVGGVGVPNTPGSRSSIPKIGGSSA